MESLREASSSANSGKRLLYFSDGVMEVDDENEAEKIPVVEVNSGALVDMKTLNWGPWMWQVSTIAAGKTVAACDYLGESLASFFGITTPKYQYEINAYHRMKKAAEEEQKNQDLEIGTWVKNSVNPNTVTTPPEIDNNTAKVVEEMRY